MMKKNIISFAVLTAGIATMLSMFSIGNGLTRNTVISAEECTHSNVEHYVGNENQTYQGGYGYYVDHYSCCDCHTVWADEARTTVLGTSTGDRKNIDLVNITSYKFQWDFGGVPYYSNELGVYHKASLLGLNGFNGTGEFYVETVSNVVNDPFVSSVEFTMFNDTKFDLDTRLMDIDVVGLFDRVTITAGTSHTFELSIEQYNTLGTSGNPTRINGFQIWFTGTDTTITSADQIRITTPKFNSKVDPVAFTNNLTGQNYPTEGAWGPIPNDNGTYSVNSSYGYHYFDPRTQIPEWATLYVDFTNKSEEDVVLVFEYVIDDVIYIPAGGTATLEVPADIWNAAVEGEEGKIRFRFTTGSEVSFNMTYKLNPFIQELEAVTLTDLTLNNSYIKEFVTKLQPILDRIAAHYGNEVPSDIKAHRNYLNYATASTFTVWDYGTPTLESVNFDGMNCLKVVAATLNDKGEQGVITRSFKRDSGASTITFAIYNDQENNGAVDVFNGYGEPWNVGGQLSLKAKSWTIASYPKSYFDDLDEVSFIFLGNEVGYTYYVSTIVDYAYEDQLEGTVVYADTITCRGDGWNAATKAPTKYGEAYLANANSAVEDPGWNCTLLYLNNTTTLDAETYSHVKFYVYNSTNQALYLALKNLPSQYNFDESGNLAPLNEWKEVVVPVEIWNQQKDNHLELILSSTNGSAHVGQILVTRMVGVTK